MPRPLDMYLAIEEPEHPLSPAEPDYPTIGMFYDAIAAVFQTLSPPISTDGQLTTSLSVPNVQVPEPLTVIASLTDALAAIKTIKDQGEGTAKSPDSPEFGGELAHYYRFGEIRYGHKFVEANGEWDYTGDPVPFPDCYPVAQVPPGGYPELPASKNFNTTYSQLLAHLQDAWSGGGQDALGAAIIATPLPDGSGNYGPDFIPAPA